LLGARVPGPRKWRDGEGREVREETGKEGRGEERQTGQGG